MRLSTLTAAVLRLFGQAPDPLPDPVPTASRPRPQAYEPPPRMKRQARMEQWSISELGGRPRLRGICFGHDEVVDGSTTITSAIVWIDNERGIVETRNTVYTLGVPAGGIYPSPEAGHAH